MRQLQFREALGAGAFGTVYRADLISERGFRRPVAVKVLNMSGGAESQRMVSRIRDEARLLGLLQDDCILKVLDLVRVGGRDAVLMEYVEGADLADLIEVSRPPPRALAELGAVLAGTLHRAHTSRHPETGEPLRVVHRDVKPHNVMITARGSIKLLDFGVAKAAFDSRESRTGQLVLGTLQYMAHDYILTGDVSPALDLYGLGLLLGEAATGERFGRPQLTEARYKARLAAWLDNIPTEYSPLLPVIQRVLSWDAARRGTAGAAERELLRVADEVSGRGLRRWCAEAVSMVTSGREPSEDLLELTGRTIAIDDSAFGAEGAALWPPPPATPGASPGLAAPGSAAPGTPASAPAGAPGAGAAAPGAPAAALGAPGSGPAAPALSSPALSSPALHAAASADRPPPWTGAASTAMPGGSPAARAASAAPSRASAPAAPRQPSSGGPSPGPRPPAQAPPAPQAEAGGRTGLSPVVLGLLAGGGLGLLALALLALARTFL